MADTRFDGAHPGAKRYKAIYDKPQMHHSVRKLEQGGQAYGIGPSEAALRWLFYHSPLEAGDEIILGASRQQQVQQNVEQIRRGQSPDVLTVLFKDVWADIAAASESVKTP